MSEEQVVDIEAQLEQRIRAADKQMLELREQRHKDLRSLAAQRGCTVAEVTKQLKAEPAPEGAT